MAPFQGEKAYRTICTCRGGVQWRRQRGADGARAPPFVFHQLQLSLNHLDLSIYSALYCCLVTRMMSFNGNVGKAIYCACLLLMKSDDLFFR